MLSHKISTAGTRSASRRVISRRVPGQLASGVRQDGLDLGRDGFGSRRSLAASAYPGDRSSEFRARPYRRLVPGVLVPHRVLQVAQAATRVQVQGREGVPHPARAEVPGQLLRQAGERFGVSPAAVRLIDETGVELFVDGPCGRLHCSSPVIELVCVTVRPAPGPCGRLHCSPIASAPALAPLRATSTRPIRSAPLRRARHRRSPRDQRGLSCVDDLRVLGPDHLHTFITRATLADMLGAAALADQAVSQVRDLLTDCLRVLGPDHPHTLRNS
jgi:hypothetical protein